MRPPKPNRSFVRLLAAGLAGSMLVAATLPAADQKPDTPPAHPAGETNEPAPAEEDVILVTAPPPADASGTNASGPIMVVDRFPRPGAAAETEDGPPAPEPEPRPEIPSPADDPPPSPAPGQTPAAQSKAAAVPSAPARQASETERGPRERSSDNRRTNRADREAHTPGTASPAASSAGSTNGTAPPSSPAENPAPKTPAAVDFNTFRIISERNIFDPSRGPRRQETRTASRPKSTEHFALVGVMSYDKGPVAFFDGSSASYRKAARPQETIAGWKIAAINGDSVGLAAGTNTVQLAIGRQMKREEEGEWRLAESPAAWSPPSKDENGTGKTDSPAAAAPGAESEVLKRLMQRREQE